MKHFLTAILFFGFCATLQAAEMTPTLTRDQQVYQQNLNDILTSAQKAQQDAEKALVKSMADLPIQYRQLLVTQEGAQQIRGDLDGVLATRKERIHFEETKELPPKAKQSYPFLFETQTNILKTLRIVERTRSRRIMELTEKYLSHLTQLRKTLTTNGQIDDAVAVDTEIARVNAMPEIKAARLVVAEEATNIDTRDRLPDVLSLRTKAGIRSAVAIDTEIALVNVQPEITNAGLVVAEDANIDPRDRLPDVLSLRTKAGIRRAVTQWNPGLAGVAAETAVLRALRWLKKNQKSDGSWEGTGTPAMTAMALLCFLAHGETPAESQEFGATVKKAIDWFMANQNANGRFNGTDGNEYSHPIAAYAVCEAYALTQQPSLKELAVNAITEVVKGQHVSGGFNYKLEAVSERNDSSYMAWCCQALKAAKVAGLDKDVAGLDGVIKKAVAAFRQNAGQSGGFGYTGPGAGGLSGAGAYCMQVLGAPRFGEVVRTIKFLDTCTFSFATPDKQPYGGGSQVYYWYYITQAKFHHSPETFAAWNKQFSPELCKQQIVEKFAIEGPDGKLADIGHWKSPCQGEHTGGLVQDTSLCALQLMVYYRYKPSYTLNTGSTSVASEDQQKKLTPIKSMKGPRPLGNRTLRP
ncbi:MAG: prenyltransferase/squalene oxidase repeat-containing protein [Kiritimatiellia bacterium]